MYRSIFSSRIVRILSALFVIAAIYMTIEAFRDGYRKGKRIKMQVELSRQAK